MPVPHTNRELRALDSIPLQIWRSRADGFTEYLNKRWLDYMGTTLDQALGWQWLVTIHPDDLPGLRDTWGKVLASGKPGEAEARMRRFDGVYRWFLLRAEPVHSKTGAVEAWYGTNTDIEDRKQAEQKLRDSELDLRQMTETIPEMLWSATADGAIDYCNARLLHYTGVSANDIKGGGWTKLLHPDDIGNAAKVWQSCVATGAPYRVEVRTIHAPDRTYRWCVTNALPLLDEQGRVLKWHGTVVDMHDWKQAQEDLRNTQSELAHLTRMMTIGELTASIAHEVNQPLSGIVTNASTCLRMLNATPPNVEGAKETARRTIRDGNRASEVIKRLRALFSKKDPALEPVDLNEATREVIALSLSKLQANRVILRTELADGLPNVSGDRVQLQQVILNLIQNGSDAMSSIDDRPRDMLVKTERDGLEALCLTVRDAGVGFSEENGGRLFDAFYTTKGDGMGIGLSVSRSIVERHGGRMWAASNEGPGVSFSFSVPLLPEQETDAETTVRS